MDKDLTLEDLQAEILAAYRKYGRDDDKHIEEFTAGEISIIIKKSITSSFRWLEGEVEAGRWTKRTIIYRKHNQAVYKLVK
ncbi:hypothetical protein CCP3SC15_4350003 [Gammaproteobacteria bacterium]